MIHRLRIATRNSPLALWQAGFIADRLSQVFPKIAIELVPMTTSGDRFLNQAKTPQGGKGLFVKELEEALLQNRADIAVHSMKDVPAIQPQGLGIVAISERSNPYDAFVSHHYTSIDSLPHQAVVGTSSLRRQSQLLAHRPDLTLINIRGNIQTRINQMQSRPCDAIILAAAGLIRMNLQTHLQQIIPEDLMLPACGQGALGIECRLDDTSTRAHIAALDDPITALCVTTEREVNARLGGNCHIPLAVYCHMQDINHMVLRAKVLSADGSTVLTALCTGQPQNATSIAEECTQQLLAQGAQQLLHSASL